MSQENIKNPAIWLLDLWGRLPTSGDVITKSTMVGWASAFGLKVDDTKVFESIASVYSTVDDAKTLVQRLTVSDRKKTQLSSWTPAFEEALTDLSRGRTWQNAISRFTPDRKVHLEYCATELDVAIEKITTIEEIQKQAEHISHLLSELDKDNSVDQSFKSLMHDLFEALRRALSEYMIRGNKGVMDSISVIFANIFRYKDHFDTEEKKKWGVQLREVVSLAADVATITGITALTIGPSVSGFLPF